MKEYEVLAEFATEERFILASNMFGVIDNFVG